MKPTSLWSELVRKEDWWAIWIGLGLIAVAALLFGNGGSIKWLTVAPQKWSRLSDVLAQLHQNGLRYGTLFVLWAVLFGLGLASLGIKLATFLPAFLVVFVVTTALYFLGLWDQASHYNLEPPSWPWDWDFWCPTPSARRDGSNRRCGSSSTSRPASYFSAQACH